MATASKATSIPKTLGHFRITNKIGVGGMGEVYLAHDKKLDRDVALKVLTPELLSDKIARKRFHKEALALSRLNHPRIATVYDFDTQDGVDFLLMEYIPGKTIGEMLRKGAMEEKEVARYGMQLAEGLVAAHDQGVIHRDLKPGNLRVTPDGWLKILDFGLAKLLRAPDSSVTTQVLSETNVAAGTLPYMAPEQLRGDDEDARTDLYTAGVVLYEMATRRRPFEEKVATALAADIMHKPVTPPGRLNHKISTRLEEIILKCMEKEPENRYQTARDLLTDLRRLSSPDGTVTLRSIPISRTKRRRRRVPWALAAGMTMIAALSLWALWQAKPWASQPVARFTVQPAARERLQGVAPSLALSPDGANLVYRAVRSGRARLYRRPMGELKASALAGTDGARSPFFLPTATGSPSSRTES